jgi:hypothetical protein
LPRFVTSIDVQPAKMSHRDSSSPRGDELLRCWKPSRTVPRDAHAAGHAGKMVSSRTRSPCGLALPFPAGLGGIGHSRPGQRQRSNRGNRRRG